MKISEYPESTSLMDNSVFIVDDGGCRHSKDNG